MMGFTRLDHIELVGFHLQIKINKVCRNNFLINGGSWLKLTLPLMRFHWTSWKIETRRNMSTQKNKTATKTLYAKVILCIRAKWPIRPELITAISVAWSDKMSPDGLELGPVVLVTSELTMRPSRLPWYLWQAIKFPQRLRKKVYEKYSRNFNTN